MGLAGVRRTYAVPAPKRASCLPRIPKPTSEDVTGGPPAVGCVRPEWLDVLYSEREMPVKATERNQVVARMSGYLDRLFSRVGQRVENRLVERVEHRVVERVEATLDVLSDHALLEDLQKADAEPDEEARPLEEVMRELDRAEA